MPTQLQLRKILRTRNLVAGATMLSFVLLVALAAPWFAPQDPMAMNPAVRLLVPGPQHLWGTDELGRDIFSRVVYGARLSLEVGGLVVFGSGVAGVLVGLLAGQFVKFDGVLMRFMDGLMAFPAVLLALSIMAVTGAKVSNVILALSVVMTPRVAILVRSAALSLRTVTYVEAARAVGGAELYITRRHIFPNILAPLIVQLSYVFAFALLVEASLSFLGLGAPPDVPSWGTILSDSRRFIFTQPWMPFLPGLAIMWTVLSLNLLGDGLRDLLDPRLRP